MERLGHQYGQLRRNSNRISVGDLAPVTASRRCRVHLNLETRPHRAGQYQNDRPGTDVTENLTGAGGFAEEGRKSMKSCNRSKSKR